MGSLQNTDTMLEGSGRKSRKHVAVIAAPATPYPGRLLDALERAFPVRFVRSKTIDVRPLDGVLVLDPERPSTERRSDAAGGLPQLRVAAGRPMGTAGEVGTAPKTAGGTGVTLADHPELARPLRGLTIVQDVVAEDSTGPGTASALVLASVAGRPVWWRDLETAGRLWFSRYPLAELEEGETLREHLRVGRFMGLLPLLHFLGELVGEEGWTLPPLRASFVIDDPNLHWPSYGFLDYRELVERNRRFGYHVGFATVPLDGWLVNGSAARIVRENPRALSLLIHGNDHVARELGRLRTEREAESTIAQALKRIEALERRSGVGVQRVIAPPHGACSEAALAAMFKLGVDAACISRPYPWRDGMTAPTPLAGWAPAELVAGGLPILPRYSLAGPLEELAFRAMLGQPLIVYGHHGDCEDGLEVLDRAAGFIDGLGEVRWGPLGGIARGNFSTRRVGETLHLQMHARRISLEVPDGIRTLEVQVDEPLGGAQWDRLAHASETADMGLSAGVGRCAVSVASGSTIELALQGPKRLDPEGIHTGRAQPWPIARRLMVEARDRLEPIRIRSSGQERTFKSR